MSRQTEYNKKRYNTDPEYRQHSLDQHELYRRQRRQQCVEAYGGVCACCGEERLVFLCIDHIGGGGTQHRKVVGTSDRFFRWLIREGFPAGFRVLCWNCNHAEHMGGCPHQEQEQVAA